MNIIEIKKKYNSAYKLNIEGMDIYYRPFNASEISLINDTNNDKYKYDISRSAVINKSDYDIIERWQSKEVLYNSIMKSSVIDKDDDIIAKKLEMKERFDNNIFFVLIKNILSVLPTIDINELLSCNIDQLIFYVVLCEEISGKEIINTDPLNKNRKNNRRVRPAIPPEPHKKMQYKQADMIDEAMIDSTNALAEHLKKHGVSPVIYNGSDKRDQFEER